MVAAFGVFAYLQLRYPPSKAFDTPWVNDFAVLGVFLGALAPIAWAWGAREFRRRADWALDGRRPRPSEREQLLVEPFRMAARPFALWVVAAAAVAGIAAARRVLAGIEIFDIAQILVMGGLATCSISYLVIEQTYRPLFACALADAPLSRPRSLGIRPRLLLAWAASSGVPLLGLFLVPFREAATSPIAIGVLSTLGIGAGLFATTVAANSIAEPLDEVRAAPLARVAVGDLSGDLRVDDGGEVGQVQSGFNQMVNGLRERQQLQRPVRPSRRPGGRRPGARAGLATWVASNAGSSVIFVDLIGSTAMAEVLPPGEVVATLNAFFRAVVDTVTQEGGWVNKFQGDGALCVFGVPGFQPDHEAAGPARRPEAAGPAWSSWPRTTRDSTPASVSRPARSWPATWATRSASSSR